MRTVTILWILTVAVSVCNAQWVQTSGTVGSVTTCFALKDTNLFAGVFGGGVFRSTNGGTIWTAVNNGLGTNPPVYCLAVRGTVLFAGAYDGVFLSTNDGTNWIPANNGLTNTNTFGLAVIGTNLFAGTNDAVFRSTDNGTNWTAVSTGFPQNTPVFAFAVSGTNLFAGTGGNGVYRSTNNGTLWTAVNTGLTYVYVNDLAVMGANLFAGTSYGIFRSTNIGLNWISFGLTGISVEAVSASGTHLFVGTRGSGVLVGSGIDTGWTAVNTGLGNANVLALAVSGTNLLAGTFGGSVWRRPLSEMIADVEGGQQLPAQFALGQNYPNPFNPVTSFQFSIGSCQLTILKVFDVLGREVATLLNEVKPPGTYTVRWDAGGQSSGVYVCRLKSGDFVETNKLVLLR